MDLQKKNNKHLPPQVSSPHAKTSEMKTGGCSGGGIIKNKKGNSMFRKILFTVLISLLLVGGALSNPAQYPLFQAIDADGNPVAGGLVYFYEAGTTTPKVAYSDAAFTAAAANPIVLDSKGEFTFYLNGAYKIDVKTSAGVQVDGFPIDNISSDLYGSNAYESIAALKASNVLSVDGRIVVVSGYYAAGDGGGQTLYWDASSVLGENLYTVFRVTGVDTGRWRSVDPYALTARNGGAYGDGGTDDRAALANLDTLGDIILPAGSYKISSNISFTNKLIFQTGASLSIDTAVLVTTPGGIGFEGRQYNTGAGTLTNTGTSVAMGVNSARVNAGAGNISIGDYTLMYNTTGHNLTAIGLSTLNRNTTGIQNTAVGSAARAANTTGSYNTDFGRGAGRWGVAGGSHSTFGSLAATNFTGGDGGTYIGVETGHGYNTGEMLDDGGLDDIATHWTTSSGAMPSGGWTDGGSWAAKSADGTNALWDRGGNAPILATIGLNYKIIYTINAITVGSVTVSYGGVSDAARSTNGTFTFNVLTVSTARLAFTPTNTSRFNITNVAQTMEDTVVGGTSNTFIGRQADYFRFSGDNNVGCGAWTLMNNATGTGNAAFGPYAGKWTTGDGQLFIDGRDRTTMALEKTNGMIYGVFNAVPASQLLTVNAQLLIPHGVIHIGAFSATGVTNGTLYDTPTRRKSSCDTNAATDHNHFYTPTGLAGWIRTTAGTTAFTSASDYRLKENDIEITDGIERVKLLRPISFNFKKSPSYNFDGFFAHEVTPAVPCAVSGEKDGVDEDGEIIRQGLDQAKMVPVLTAALKESIVRIERLERAVLLCIGLIVLCFGLILFRPARN